MPVGSAEPPLPKPEPVPTGGGGATGLADPTPFSNWVEGVAQFAQGHWQDGLITVVIGSVPWGTSYRDEPGDARQRRAGLFSKVSGICDAAHATRRAAFSRGK